MATNSTRQRRSAMPPDPDNPFLTEDAAAARSTLAPRTLQHLRKHGGGPPFAKLGKRIVYRREDLDRWIAARVTNPERNH